MPGGRRSPMSHLAESLSHALHKGKGHAHEMAQTSKDLKHHVLDGADSFVDLQIQFIGASGLPKMDVVGSADPYFVAKLDDRISFVSTVKQDTLSPVWNEIWRVKNVPKHADLQVEVLDKDTGAPHDDYIGKFKTSVNAGTKEVEIEGSILKRTKGTFWLKIECEASKHPNPQKAPYMFDGPIRYSRHCSPTVGRLTNLNTARLYSTWKMYIRGIQLFFGDQHQHWNRNYKAAQQIFQGPTSFAVRSGVQAGHRMLYARSTTNGFGTVESRGDFLELFKGGGTNVTQTEENGVVKETPRIKPAVYTYIISSEDDSFRFSETGAAFFVDFASKHALHANCFETVRYSGEFHPRPKGGWENFSDDIPDDQIEWEFVIDNNSGTYSPDPMMLPQLKELLEYNFPDLTIVAMAHEDPRLKPSTEATRAYALKYRGVKQEELQPTNLVEGEETLCHKASVSSTTATTGHGRE